MFVPVACLKCGKPFQVPEAAAGTTVTCPWCKLATSALPVAGLTGNEPPPPPGAPTPALSLDDAPPADLPVAPVVAPPPPARQPVVPVAPPKPRKPFPFKTAAIVLVASAVCGVVAFLVVGVARGRIPVPGRGVDRIPDGAWSDFTPPDGSCTVSLPGSPSEAESFSGTGKRYTTRGWFSGVTTWVGWIDLEGEWLQKARTPEAWHLLRPRFEAVLDKQKGEWNATVVRQTTKKYDDPLTVEVEMQLPDGYAVERFVVVPKGAHPRIYYLGLAGRGVTADCGAAQKLFGSLRPEKE
jgi:hypothetical protein